MAFFWWQQKGGEDEWKEALSEHRSKIIAELHPAFTTILDAHTSPSKDWTREQYLGMKYSGPFYADWDAEDVADTIQDFQKFLAKLQVDMGVNLASIRLYATGGRGFHVEIPEDIFMLKVPKGGTQALPSVYKEMAFEMVSDTLDMRVYTSRKGRQWRTPNIVRANNLYKVPITVDEALNMTAELYATVCASPRPEFEREPRAVALGLAAMFVKASDKIGVAVKKQAKATGDIALLAKFKGNFPPSMQRVMAGEGVMQGVGFQRFSMQLAIAANAMGKTADELVDACEGLIKSHRGDSSRYGTVAKRREELRRMHEYTLDNPCYTFSAGGIRSLMEPGSDTSDLDTVDRSKEGSVFMGEDTETEELTEEQAAEIAYADRGQMAGVMLMKSGIYCRTGDGLKPLSTISLTRPTRMLSCDDRMHVGFECDVLISGKFHSRSGVPLDTFTGRSRMHTTFSAYGGTFLGNDIQAGAILTALDKAAKDAGREIYVVHREGLDLVQNPTVDNRIDRDILWATTENVLTSNEAVQYRFKPKLANEAVFKSDIGTCDPIENTPETREWLHAVFNINTPLVVSQMLGWFVSCLHKQFYHESYKQFPLLHPHGQAGSGKSLTTLLFARLYHNTSTPLAYGCGVPTAFTLKAACAGSCSIPLILDEYKPSELPQIRTDLLMQIFRLSFNQSMGATGGISKGGAVSSFRDITNYEYSAPIVFMAESQEMQTAIVQRSLPISFTERGRVQHTKHWTVAESGVNYMPMLGAALLRAGMQETVASRKEALAPLIKDLRESLSSHVHDRQVYNLAIVMAGLNFLDATLERIFGDDMKADIDRLRQSLFVNRAEIAVMAVNESAKAMNDLSLISRTEDSESEFSLREGHEYLIGEGYMEIKMRETFVKYLAWNKRKGLVALFNNQDAFIGALGRFDACVDKVCMQSPLKTSGASRVYRFNLDRLTAEGVEGFLSKGK